MSQKNGSFDDAMLLSAERAIQTAAELVAKFDMDVDDFATLAKAKLLETYVAKAKKEIREREEKVADYEEQLASMKSVARGTPSTVSGPENPVHTSSEPFTIPTFRITSPPSKPPITSIGVLF